MRLPEIVSSAGMLGNKIVQPSQAGKDTFSDSSYWWLFKDLRDKTNIDWAGRNGIRDHGPKQQPGSGHTWSGSHRVKRPGRRRKKVFQSIQPDSEEQKNLDIPDTYAEYVGVYTIPMQNLELAVMVKDGHLALDIPGQAVIDLEGPDESGRWVFSVDDTRSISFVKGRKGNITAVNLHSLFTLPKKKIN